MEKIVVLGSINLDYVSFTSSLPKLGQTVQGNKFQMLMGGKGANQAVQAARLGAQVHMIGCVGNDEPGKMMLASLKNNNIDTTYIKVHRTINSGACAINVDEKGNNTLIITPQSNLEIDKDLIDSATKTIKNAQVFITQLETNLDAVYVSLEIARKNNIITILNPAPVHKIPDDVYKNVDFFVPNETEAELFSGILRSDFSNIEDWYKLVGTFFMDKGVKNLVVTLGEKGALFVNKEENFIVPPHKIIAVDTTAAGDAFIGGLAYSIAKGLSVKQGMEFGCKTGAYAATGVGAQDSLGTLKQITELFK